MTHQWEEGRYEVAQIPDERGRGIYGIRDHHRGGAWVEEALDLVGTIGPMVFSYVGGAEQWLVSLKSRTEGRLRS